MGFLIETLNHRFYANDFKVYYEASRDFFNNQNPYTQSYGLSSGFFKYAPGSLLLFLPYQLISFETAKILQFILCSFLFIHSLLISLKLLKNFSTVISQKTLLIGSLILLFGAVHLTRELHLLNINIVMIWLTLNMIYNTLNNRQIISAILLCLMLLFKPYFGILLLPLIIKKEFRICFYTLITFLILSSLTVFIGGIDFAKNIHLSWLNNMLGHQDNMISEHTFSSIITSYSGIQLSPAFQLILIVLISIGFIFFRIKKFIQKTYSNTDFIFDSFMLLAIIPNLVITDSEHFMYSLPLIGLIISRILETKKPIIHWLIFIVLIFFYGANSNDLLGNPLSDAFDRFSTIGVANLGLIILAFYYHHKRAEINLK